MRGITAAAIVGAAMGAILESFLMKFAFQLFNINGES